MQKDNPNPFVRLRGDVFNEEQYEKRFFAMSGISKAQRFVDFHIMYNRFKKRLKKLGRK